MKIQLSDKLWDLWCVISLIGIWPRFVEPRLLLTSKLTLEIEGLDDAFDGMTLVQFSDLHLNGSTSRWLLKRLRRKVEELKPDMVLFGGDALCFAGMPCPEELAAFFETFPKAPLGNYAILGNHDYEKFVSLNEEGDYDIIPPKERGSSLIARGFKRIMTTTIINKKVKKGALEVKPHPALVELFARSPFRLLNNETVVVKKGKGKLNICGFGEYMAGQASQEAYRGYDKEAPGLLLLHNPDGIPQLRGAPGDLILCGHTHAGQVNLPYLWRRFAVMENPQFKKGLVESDGRPAYINRGMGHTLPFRWFAPPELLHLTLKKKGTL